LAEDAEFFASAGVFQALTLSANDAAYARFRGHG
jgi:hypothetical protein